jgi:hypothetical protein
MDNIDIINKTKTLLLFNYSVELDLELLSGDDGSFIYFKFSINNLDVLGIYKLNKFILYSVRGGILSENIVKKLQEELEIIYLDNFD